MQNVYTVAQVNSYIKNMFTQDYMMRSLLIKGEVSNCKYHSSGHIYFTLKDNKGTLACVMFAGNREGLQFQLREGQQVIVGGNVDVYERDGKYQLYAKEIILDGAGFLYEKFEQLKIELEERGLFAAEYKQNIPFYVKTLGVVTAPTGAAVQDIIQIAKRRNPYIQIYVYPAIVQGEQAVASIVQGIRALEAQKVDVMIVGRGGGSIEDLWAFNEEAVAQAIFDCSIPIISAVGHETDTTIADYVADMRAPTPSAAAELASVDIKSVMQKITEYRMGLQRNIVSRLQFEAMKTEHYKIKLQNLSPMNQLKDKKFLALQLEEQLQNNMTHILSRKQFELSIYIERMRGLSPLDKLKQGFSFVTDKEGKCINRIDGVAVNDELSIQTQNGIIETKAIKIVPESLEKRYVNGGKS